MECVSLFSGAGGLDLGFRAAGFSMISSVEQDVDCCATLRANGFDHVSEANVETWLESEDASRLRPAVVVGGPPCQPFSKSAYWSSSSAQGLVDERADCVRTFVRAVSKLRPSCFLIENVPGFVTAGGVEFVEQALNRLRPEGLDYKFAWRVLNCADYGVPQKRQRFFGVGSLQAGFQFPAETHSSSHLTAWDALQGLRPTRKEELRPKGRWADLLPTIPEGQNYLWHTAKGGGLELFGWRTRYWSFLQKLSKSEPSPTIVATPAQDAGPFHWTNRHLSTDELAALQTFPRSYEFCGTRVARRRQIGNAVPPLMSEILARQIAQHLGAATTGTLHYLVLPSERKPRASRTFPLPEKYKQLVGPRAPHAGVGKGPCPRVLSVRS